MRPEMPDYGVYLNWPEEGTHWIHPEDVELVEKLIPSERVFRREAFDGEYYHLSYGDLKLRVKPSLWTTVRGEGFDVGDHVEIHSRFGNNTPLVGAIHDMHYSQTEQRIVYQIIDREFELPKNFYAEDLIQHTPRIQIREGDTTHPPQKYEPMKGMETLPLD